VFTQKVTIHYVDGSQKDVVLDQWSIGQFAAYATKMGWDVDPNRPGMLAILMLRFQTWAQLHRDVTGAKPGFDIWDRTVREVEPEEPEQPDPTQTATSEG
jgi:hypothetical protein